MIDFGKFLNIYCLQNISKKLFTTNLMISRILIFLQFLFDNLYRLLILSFLRFKKKNDQ